MLQEKVDQTYAVLKEKGIDAWMIFARESHTMADPAMPMVVGGHCTWMSAFIFTATGESIAIVGNLDQPAFDDLKHFTKVLSYKEGLGEMLRAEITRINPEKIALNFSQNDYMSDGLTYGMYLQLQKIFKDTPYADRFVTAETIIAAVRGRKSATEIARIKTACEITLDIYDKVGRYAKPGMTEKDIADFIISQLNQLGLESAWDIAHCPAVYTGPDTAGAHYGPTGRTIERGHIMNIDFGVKKDDYVSDLQRTWYFLKENETEAPAPVIKAFDTIRDSIQAAADALKPGKMGWEIDKIARDYIVAQGFDEYPHALGHQVGREAHDGAGTLAPRWERYGNVPFMKIEAGQVYTIEPRAFCPGFGTATMEEI
ncbi:aminopeptidase P family protein, partial [bacterium]|nr:aminopeptidase P family protein [bacterium]